MENADDRSPGRTIRTIQADDERAVALGAPIRSGHVESMERHLRDIPEPPTARAVDTPRPTRTLLHLAANWPGQYHNGSDTVAILIRAAANVDAPAVHPGPHASAETPMHGTTRSDDVDGHDAILDARAHNEARAPVFTGATPISDAVEPTQ